MLSANNVRIRRNVNSQGRTTYSVRGPRDSPVRPREQVDEAASETLEVKETTSAARSAQDRRGVTRSRTRDDAQRSRQSRQEIPMLRRPASRRRRSKSRRSRDRSRSRSPRLRRNISRSRKSRREFRSRKFGSARDRRDRSLIPNRQRNDEHSAPRSERDRPGRSRSLDRYHNRGRDDRQSARDYRWRRREYDPARSRRVSRSRGRARDRSRENPFMRSNRSRIPESPRVRRLNDERVCTTFRQTQTGNLPKPRVILLATRHMAQKVRFLMILVRIILSVNKYHRRWL